MSYQFHLPEQTQCESKQSDKAVYLKGTATKNEGPHPQALVQTDVDDAPEEDEVAFRKFESLELGSKQVSVFGQEVLEQEGVDRAAGKRNKGQLMVRNFSPILRTNICVCQTAWPGLYFDTILSYHFMPWRRDSNPSQQSCTRLGPFKDALLTELHSGS